ncbi:hypothetical protein [uncultured Dokdonia sp.]|nr:hypothetical protein [uncultured Dokdonia sp.]
MKNIKKQSTLKEISKKNLCRIQGGNAGSDGRYLQNGSYGRIKTLTLGNY